MRKTKRNQRVIDRYHHHHFKTKIHYFLCVSGNLVHVVAQKLYSAYSICFFFFQHVSDCIGARIRAYRTHTENGTCEIVRRLLSSVRCNTCAI